MRRSVLAAMLLLWLSPFVLACTSGTRPGGSGEAGTGGSAVGPPAASGSGGNAAAPSAPAGAGGGASDPGSAAAASTVAHAPLDSGVRPMDAGVDAAPTTAGDASAPADASGAVNQPGCPAQLPEVYAICSREGLMCEYGMECCPDFAYCEFGQWSVLTHHCDACI